METIRADSLSPARLMGKRRFGMHPLDQRVPSRGAQTSLRDGKSVPTQAARASEQAASSAHALGPYGHHCAATGAWGNSMSSLYALRVRLDAVLVKSFWCRLDGAARRFPVE